MVVVCSSCTTYQKIMNKKRVSSTVIELNQRREFAGQQHLSLGYSSLKSRDIRGVHSRSLRILATISLPCHFPHHSYSTLDIHKYQQ